jgi:hypothetical protein
VNISQLKLRSEKFDDDDDDDDDNNNNNNHNMLNFIVEIQRMWNVKTKVIPLTGAIGTI